MEWQKRMAEIEAQNIAAGKCPKCGGSGVVAALAAVATLRAKEEARLAEAYKLPYSGRGIRVSNATLKETEGSPSRRAPSGREQEMK